MAAPSGVNTGNRPMISGDYRAPLGNRGQDATSEPANLPFDVIPRTGAEGRLRELNDADPVAQAEALAHGRLIAEISRHNSRTVTFLRCISSRSTS